MKNTLLSAVSVALLFAAIPGSTWAQSDGELNVRMTQMEDQLRRLMGQVEELNFQVGRLQSQLGAANKSGAVEPQQQAPRRKKQVAQQDDVQGTELAPPPSQGVEQIGDNAYSADQPMTIIDENGNKTTRAPGPKILGTLNGTNYEGGQVLVPEGQGDTGGQILVPPVQGNNGGGQVVMPSGSSTADIQPDNGGATGNDLVPDSVETVSLGAAATDNPEALYEQSYESLLRRQFGDAEVGFRGFLDKHRNHSLAGNAQYWLGETYYVQGDYKQAAQTFLTGYREFPKSRKAADSLLKLGLSLNRLGQRQQACAAYSQVGEQFPKSTEAKKRAQAEIKRAGC